MLLLFIALQLTWRVWKENRDAAISLRQAVALAMQSSELARVVENDQVEVADPTAYDIVSAAANVRAARQLRGFPTCGLRLVLQWRL